MKILKNKKTIILVLSIAILSLIISLIIYFASNDNNTNKTAKITNWMDYIMNQDIENIEIQYCIEEEISQEETNDIYSITITEDDLQQIFSNMKQGTITKHYSIDIYDPCMTSLNIKYKNNNKAHILELPMYSFVKLDNAEKTKLLSYLEQNEYTIEKWNENADIKTEPFMFEYKYDKTIIHALIEKYKNTQQKINQ